MGVPALFRWLSKKYPKIVKNVIEEQPLQVHGVEIPVDISKPNPNGVEFDNLYLDMNGIIHPCCHPDNKEAPATEDEMMVEIFKYTERIVAMIRPRKILYLAIDGVAPRAKMNQQRSRRFRTAKESKEKEEEAANLLQELQDAGGSIDPLTKPKKVWDSNCITPGTPFMANLANCLRYWIADKLNTDPGWKNLKVIFSDANVPGEGEHKIMEFIRSQRMSPDHDPNTRHVIYGLDADLIMLSLATHEPHFKVLREDVFFNEGIYKGCYVCGQTDHQASQCTGKAKQKQGEFDEKAKATGIKPYIFLDVSVLREYLEIELNVQNTSFDLENAIDDWVFLCFFVGNDFLPHLPSLEIREGAIDTLTKIWKKILPITGGYITHSGNVNLTRAQYLVTELGYMEDDIFRRRHEQEQRRSPANKKRRIQENEAKEMYAPPEVLPAPRKNSPSVPIGIPILPVKGVDPRVRAQSNSDVVNNRAAIRMSNIQVAESTGAGLKRNSEEIAEPEETVEEELAETEIDDEVRLWEPGFKERYYKSKEFGVELKDEEFRNTVAKSYIEGLCWVLKYYFQGVPSWKWYYPYHYAPFASDFVNIGDINIKFDLGTPFRPFEQLMGVLPTDSKEHLPSAFARLMFDENSEIIDFYPEDFEIDLNGKKFSWQGVALLPFIDEQRLLKALENVYPSLTDEEKVRNSLGCEMLCFGNKHKLYEELCPLYGKRKSDNPIPLNPTTSDGLVGYVAQDPNCIPGSTFYSPLTHKGKLDIVNDKSLSVLYHLPPKEGEEHKSVLLKNVKLPPRVLQLEDHDWVRSGGRRGRGGSYNNTSHGHNRNDTLRSENNRSYGSFDSKFQNQGRYSGGYQQPRYDHSRSYEDNNRPYGRGYSPNFSNQGRYSGGYQQQWNDNSRSYGRPENVRPYGEYSQDFSSQGRYSGRGGYQQYGRLPGYRNNNQ